MQSERPTRIRYGVLAALSAAAAIVYVQRQALANAESTMRCELGFSKTQMGFVLSIWLWTYAIFQIPGGRLGDRWGSQRALPLYCAIWSVCTILTGFVHWLPGLLLVRLLFGAAHAGLFPCAAIILKRWFPEEKRGVATGVLAACQQVGAATGAYLAGGWLTMFLILRKPAWMATENIPAPSVPGWLARSPEYVQHSLGMFFDWRVMFVFFALPGLVWAVWFWRWFRDRPTDHPGVNEEELALLTREPPAVATPVGINGGEPAPAPPEVNIWWAMLSSSTMWLIAGQQFCRGAGYFFFQSWFPTYLQEARGMTLEKSGTFTSLMFIAALFGALLGGFVSDWILARTGSRRAAKQGVAIFGLLGASALAVAAYFTRSPHFAVGVLAAGSFCASLAGPAGYSITIDVAGKNTATIFGAMNMSGNIGAAIFPLAVTTLLSLAERGQFVERYGVSGWDLVLFAFAGVYFLGALCWMFLNPHRAIGERE